MKIKLILFPQATYNYCSESSGGWRSLIPHEDKVDVVTTVKIGHRGLQNLIPHDDQVDVSIPFRVKILNVFLYYQENIDFINIPFHYPFSQYL